MTTKNIVGRATYRQILVLNFKDGILLCIQYLREFHSQHNKMKDIFKAETKQMLWCLLQLQKFA
jgi:hypothetical protein